jgi:hypothetical protein
VFVVSDDDGAEVVKIVDFGIVKLLDPTGTHEPLTRIGMVFGTPAYMAPEQAAGGKIDARTDLYGVGILLYEMLAGAPPFRADQPGIVLRQHMLAEPPPLPDTIPTPVREVVAKLLAKAAADRYATARDARDALQEAIASRAARSRGDLVFLPAITDEGEASPPPAEKPRRETWRGSAPLGDPQPQAGTPPRRTPTIRVDLGAAGSAAAPASTTDLAGILAKPAPPLPSSPLEPGRAAETSGALPVEAARAAETSGALPVAAATSGARPVDPAIAGAPMPSFGGSGTVRVTPNVEAHPQRPKGLGTKTTLLLLVLLVAAVAASLYASGAFAGPAKPRVEGGDG